MEIDEVYFCVESQDATKRLGKQIFMLVMLVTRHVHVNNFLANYQFEARQKWHYWLGKIQS
jgi:hypothetical protein